ncbi:MAG: ABC transporter ATP-binding protein [Inquilinus sp.]|nr:ABC transporter ATP-binding protein [Inquilinus sp.]
MARVTLDTVNKIYPSRHGPVHAVQDLDITIEDGEFVAVLGPSGCGKTSTLRMIVGLETITGGTIRFDDRPVNELTPEQRNVAMAFETYALYPNFTIAENLGFPLEVRGVDRKAREAEVLRVARLLRIEDILGHKPAHLSGGQQQRVSLGRALIRDPAVFILDEVMSHLDAHLKLQMLFELKRIHQSMGKTMVYVTHDQMEALALADRVAVMSNARLQQFGTRDELYHAPANRFVADFIGEPPTNFFDAEVTETAGEIALAVPGTDLAFTTSPARVAALRNRGGKRAIVGIRPQNLFITPLDDAGSVTATVALNEYLGEQSILTFDDKGVSFRALAPPDADAKTGATVAVRYRPADVMVFDTDTEALVA